MTNAKGLYLRPFPFITVTGFLACVGVLAFAGVISRSEGAPAETGLNAFAGRETLLVVGIKDHLSRGERVWFRVTKERRTIASGTARSGSAGRIDLPVQLPGMKPGVALPFEIELRADSEQGRLMRGGTLWAFSEQPFDPEHKLSASRTVVLYDPEGRTEVALRSISLACDTLDKPASLEGVTNAVIVVGEGVSLESERGLVDLLADAVARGNRVLLLAPRDGQLKPPSAWRVLLAGDAQDVLRVTAASTVPYKLKLKEWPPDGRAVQMRFHLTAERDEAIFTVSPDAGCEAIGWDDVASGGCFRSCGLGIIAKWNQTPAARWLFVELVERLANKE